MPYPALYLTPVPHPWSCAEWLPKVAADRGRRERRGRSGASAGRAREVSSTGDDLSVSHRPDPADRASADQNFAMAREALGRLSADVAEKLNGGADVVDVWLTLSETLAESAPDAEFLAVLAAAAIIQIEG
jgi:hypothetical protein